MRKFCFVLFILIIIQSNVIAQGEKYTYFGDWRPECNNPNFLKLHTNPNISFETAYKVLDSLANQGLNENNYVKYLFYKNELAHFYIEAKKTNVAIDILESSQKTFAEKHDTLHIEYIASLVIQNKASSMVFSPSTKYIDRIYNIAQLTDSLYGNNNESPLIHSLRLYVGYYLVNGNNEKYNYYFNILNNEYIKRQYLGGIALLNVVVSNKLRFNYYNFLESQEVLLKHLNKKIEPDIFNHYRSAERMAYEQNLFIIGNSLYQNNEYSEAAHYYELLLNPKLNATSGFAAYAYSCLVALSQKYDTSKTKTYLNSFFQYTNEHALRLQDKILYYNSVANRLVSVYPEKAKAMVDSTMKWSSGAYLNHSARLKASVLFKNKEYDNVIKFSKTILPFDSTKNILNFYVKGIRLDESLNWLVYVMASYYELWKQNNDTAYLNRYENYLLEFYSDYKNRVLTLNNSYDAVKTFQHIFNIYIDRYLLKPYVSGIKFNKITDNMVMDILSLTKSQSITKSITRLNNISLIENTPYTYNYSKVVNSIQKQKTKLENKADSLVSVSELIGFYELFVKYIQIMNQIDTCYKNNPLQKTHLVETTNMNIIQESLTNNQAILEYFVADTSIYISLITKNSFDLKQVNKEQVKKLSNTFARQIKTNYQINSDKLSKLLLSNLSTLNKSKTELILIPHRWLHKIPFETLSIPDSEQKVIENYTVKYNYSTQSWYLGNKNTTNNIDYKFLGIAPVFNENPDTSYLADNFRGGIELSPLPFSYGEVTAIQKIFKKNKLENFSLCYSEATKENFTLHKSNYSILHIASHGLSHKKHYERSGIYMHHNNEYGNNNNFLSLGEIFAFESQPNLVVLSACKTSTGKIVEGEGVMALPRGFIYAGAKNVIASLWKVHDEKTKDLMVAFYKHLLEDKVSYAEALRLAKLDCIEKGFLPVDWAGFVIIGS